MSLLTNTILSYWQSGRKTRQTQKGWISGNAVCCHHRGENADKKSRGGLNILGNDDGFVYSCFNCGFKTSWKTGKLLTKTNKSFLSWLGIPDDDIMKLSLDVLKHKSDNVEFELHNSMELEPVLLPPECKLITEWLADGYQHEFLSKALDYLHTRKVGLDWYDWMWTPHKGFNDRIIIPYYHDDNIVGWTGRIVIDSDKPKYLDSTGSNSSYVFNLSHQTYDRQFVIVTEGQFDAIAIDGTAIMHNIANDQQISRLNALGKEVIVVPDNDSSGAKIIDIAIEQGWSVSLPLWGDDVKDVAKAVEKYGRVYTLFTILHYKEHNKIKLTMLKQRIVNKN